MKLIPSLLKKRKSPRVGLVLSGGAARGFAHVGVIKALKEHGIEPDIVSGVSAGAIAGALFCDGHSPEEMLKIIKDKSLFKYASFTVPKNGLLSIQNMHKVLEESLRAKKFEDLQIPFYCNATNLNTGKAEYFNKGELPIRIIASASIPVLFKPVVLNNQTYVDGGVMDNFPVKPLEKQADKIIGVHVNPTAEEKEVKGLIKIAERSFHLSVNRNIEEMIQSCDLFIQPEKVKKFGLMNVSEGRKIFEAGYEGAMKVLNKTNVNKFK